MIRQILSGALLAGPLLISGLAMAEPIPVELRQTAEGWQLYRGGEPYFIKGAGGTDSLEALAAAGANSIRTWDPGDDFGALLDHAHELGLSVAAGIWLGHERHGFDYDDPAQVKEQLERVRSIVLEYRDHPAILLWGLGNEMEGFGDGDHPAVWQAVGDIARMVKELDPNHPTMTTTTFVHGERIDYVHRRLEAIDIHGINAYGGALVVADYLRDRDATKPYILTEFGPPGPWEVPTTEWGAPYEPTSSEKADFYRRAWETAISGEPGFALGGYAFLWGHKMESTPTWFGMLLEDGSPTAMVDTMQALWTGRRVDEPAPEILPLKVVGQPDWEPGEVVSFTIGLPGGDEGLDVDWALRADVMEWQTGGDFRATPVAIDSAIVSSDGNTARVRLPDYPGPYRVYATVRNAGGKAATANLPIRVEGEPRPVMPLTVYDDRFEGMPWVPSGWMGNVDAMSVDGRNGNAPYTGDACIRIRYEGPFGWAGVAWQHPANNWGDKDGGIDVTGATALEFRARGEYGGEKIGFGVGLLERDRDYPDSDIVKVDGVELTHEWKRYRVPLKGRDLSSLKTGFFVTLTGRRSAVTVYLDEIRFID